MLSERELLALSFWESAGGEVNWLSPKRKELGLSSKGILSAKCLAARCKYYNVVEASGRTS